MKKLAILSSGEGTNLQAIINAIDNGRLFNCKLSLIITNKHNTNTVNRGLSNALPTLYLPWNLDTSMVDKNSKSRIHYDLTLASFLNSVSPDIIVLAGWNHILSKEFLKKIGNTLIINLHPALLNAHPGNNAIEDAFNDYQEGHIKHTGIMVHKVTEVLDVGDVIHSCKVPINDDDTLSILKDRVKLKEKEVLLTALEKISSGLLYRGKVKDVYSISSNLMLIGHTDRLSAHNRYICDVKGKGHMLTQLAHWWFDATKHIIPNHIIDKKDSFLLVKKCKLIPYEFIIRNYITGSLWKKYASGSREYCGITFEDDLKKNQLLDIPILTPTTKDEEDRPISLDTIANEGILTSDELDYIRDICFKLFDFCKEVSKKHNLILVDTKYEFGRTSEGKIILIDEIHTIESSRYWVLDSYEKRFNEGLEPDKIDKDTLRDYLVKNKETLHETDVVSIQDKIVNSYKHIYSTLSGKDSSSLTPLAYSDQNVRDHIDTYKHLYRYDKYVVILSGSLSDDAFVSKIKDQLDLYNIHHKSHVCSAHKKTQKLLTILSSYNELKKDSIIYITVAGRSNALSGVVACNTDSPVIACPPLTYNDYLVNIHSTLQMPSNTPVMTVLDPKNVALCCKKIFKN